MIPRQTQLQRNQLVPSTDTSTSATTTTSDKNTESTTSFMIPQHSVSETTSLENTVEHVNSLFQQFLELNNENKRLKTELNQSKQQADCLFQECSVLKTMKPDERAQFLTNLALDEVFRTNAMGVSICDGISERPLVYNEWTRHFFNFSTNDVLTDDNWRDFATRTYATTWPDEFVKLQNAKFDPHVSNSVHIFKAPRSRIYGLPPKQQPRRNANLEDILNPSDSISTSSSSGNSDELVHFCLVIHYVRDENGVPMMLVNHMIPLLPEGN